MLDLSLSERVEAEFAHPFGVRSQRSAVEGVESLGRALPNLRDDKSEKEKERMVVLLV